MKPTDSSRRSRPLLVTELARMRCRLSDAPDEWSRDACWGAMEQALEDAGVANDISVAGAILGQDVEALDDILAGWQDGSEALCRSDYQTLAAALQRFSVECMTHRSDSVEPSTQIPPEVWELLITRGLLERTEDGRLRLVGRGGRNS